jgi:serine/threonine protein kinase
MKELLLQNCRIDGRYDIQNHLGRGSYAEIYVARDNLASIHSPHRFVVIKALNVFLQDDLDADLERTLVENFQNEAIALDRVRHPNIISRLGHGTARDLSGTVFHYLILEFLPGGDLAKQCQGKALQLDKVFNYLEQVCAGLAHAHKNGIIHRDIKPQNLLLTQDHKIVKIADFGVARFSQSDTPITRVGTNMYAPPEHSPVFSDSINSLVVKELTPAADIYSLAKSTYVLVTGESPRRFTNLPINDLPISFQEKTWSNDLLRVLNKATQNNPIDRHQLVNDFWKDLASVKLLTQSAEPEFETQISKKFPTIPQAAISADYTSKAPVLPRFQTSEDFRVPLTEEKNPHFVVRLPNEIVAQNQTPKPILNEKNQLQFEIPPPPLIKQSPFLKRVAMFFVFLIVFAGALFATQQYLRFGRILPGIQNPLSRTEGVANTNVNLRKEADKDSDKIGLVPKGSRVRVINTKDNWLEIDIIEYSRAKNEADLDHGWVDKRYITIDQER